jgi:hypothetical protein
MVLAQPLWQAETDVMQESSLGAARVRLASTTMNASIDRNQMS